MNACGFINCCVFYFLLLIIIEATPAITPRAATATVPPTAACLSLEEKENTDKCECPRSKQREKIINKVAPHYSGHEKLTFLHLVALCFRCMLGVIRQQFGSLVWIVKFSHISPAK